MKKSIKVISICCSSLAALVIGGLAIANNTNIKSNAKDYQISMDYQNVTNFSSKDISFDLKGKTAVEKLDFVIEGCYLYGDISYSVANNNHILQISDSGKSHDKGYFGFTVILEGAATLLNVEVEGSFGKKTFNPEYGSVSVYEYGFTSAYVDKITINYSC